MNLESALAELKKFKGVMEPESWQMIYDTLVMNHESYTTPYTNGSDNFKKYPCATCGKLRTADEGGTTFTICDECWEKKYPDKGIIREMEELKDERIKSEKEWADKCIKLQSQLEHGKDCGCKVCNGVEIYVKKYELPGKITGSRLGMADTTINAIIDYLKAKEENK